jgi:hypothetical protein
MRPLGAAHLKSISDLEGQADQGPGQRCQILAPRRCRANIWVAPLAARALGDQVPPRRDGGGLVADRLRLVLGDRRQLVPRDRGRCRAGTRASWRKVGHTWDLVPRPGGSPASVVAIAAVTLAVDVGGSRRHLPVAFVGAHVAPRRSLFLAATWLTDSSSGGGSSVAAKCTRSPPQHRHLGVGANELGSRSWE